MRISKKNDVILIFCTTKYAGAVKVFYFEITQYTNVTINFTATVNENVRGGYYIRVHTNYNRLPCDLFVYISCVITQSLQTIDFTLNFAVDDIEYTQTSDTISNSSIRVTGVVFRPDIYKDDKNGIIYNFACQY